MSDVPGRIRPFRTFILKLANRCNIDCDYCYVFHSADQSWRTLPRQMSIRVAQRAARRVADHVVRHGIPKVHIVFHGGEPLLAGREHLLSVLQAVDDTLSGLVDVRYELQTNGVLITDGWLDILERFQVRVGVSLDGPSAANDRHRVDHRRQSTWARAAHGISLLQRRPALYAGLLAVVDIDNDPAAVYRHLASFVPPTIDFNLPHATHDRPPPRNRPGEPEYGQWLSAVYDLWMSAEEFTHTVRIFEDIIALSHGVKGSVDALGLAWSGIAVVESDGSIEDVDTLKSVGDGVNQLGMTVFEHSFDDVLRHPSMLRRQDPKGMLSQQCRTCALVETCGGGHLPHRFDTSNGYRNPSVFCRDLEYLIRHIRRSLMDRGRTLADVQEDDAPLYGLGR